MTDTPIPIPAVETITPALVQTQIDPAAVQAAPPVVNTESPAQALAPAPVPAPEAPVEAKPETVLGEALKPAEAAPVEPPKPAEAPETKNEGGQSDEPAPPPKYEPFTLPEDIKLDDGRLGEFTSLLAELETSGKATHEAVQAFGQKAVEFHVNEVKSAVENITKLYQQAWDKQQVTWKEQFLADPEIGGNRFQTTVDSALDFIRTHGGTEDQQKEFRNLMNTSGLGNHPTMIRLLANAGRAMSEGRPLAATKPVSAPKSKVTTLYGSQ